MPHYWTAAPPHFSTGVYTGGGTMTAALKGNTVFQVVAGVEIEPDFADEWQAQHPDATLVQATSACCTPPNCPRSTC